MTRPNPRVAAARVEELTVMSQLETAFRSRPIVSHETAANGPGVSVQLGDLTCVICGRDNSDC
jgi:hypothetical protein